MQKSDHSSLAQYLFTQNILTSKYTLLISYILIFIVVLLLARLLVKFVEKILSKLFLGWINKLSGAFLYMFFTLFVFSSFIWLGKEVQLVSPSAEMESNGVIWASIDGLERSLNPKDYKLTNAKGEEIAIA